MEAPQSQRGTEGSHSTAVQTLCKKYGIQVKAGDAGLPGFAGLVLPKAQTFPFPKRGLLLSRWAERKPGKPANPADHGKALAISQRSQDYS
jgi:hypothetical protein